MNKLGIFEGKSDNLLNDIDVIYNEVQENHFVPRSVFIDTDSISSESISSSSMGKLFSPDNYICSNTGSTKNYSVRYSDDIADLKQIIKDTIRREVEKCDNFIGFQLINSLEGGVGSGIFSEVLNAIRYNYFSKVILTSSLYPSPQVCNSVHSLYNTVLTHSSFIDCTDLTFTFDNNSLFNILRNNNKYENEGYKDVNNIISSVISSLTASTRFGGSASNLRKIATNLVFYLRLKFMNTSVVLDESKDFNKMFDKMMNWKNMTYNNQNNIYDRSLMICSAALLRGNVNAFDIENYLINYKKKNIDHYHNAFPNSFYTSCSSSAPKGYSSSGVLIHNSTSYGDSLKWISMEFKKLFKKKANIHNYSNMDEMEFEECISNFDDIIAEYKNYFDHSSNHDQET